ncbi:hypothetical protein QQ045_018212 [Rhodiola kirilowii]
MEWLTKGINHAVIEGFIKGFHTGGNGRYINNLMFADDILILMDSVPVDKRSLYEDVVISTGEDIYISEGCENGSFTTKKFRTSYQTRWPEVRWAKNIWHTWIPMKFGCFMWNLFMKALPTDDNMKEIGINLAFRCRCCNEPSMETDTHLFFKGEVARETWKYFQMLFGGGLNGGRESLTRLISVHCPKDFITCLRVEIACCTMWEIWKNRNAKFFNEACHDIKICISRWGMDLSRLMPRKIICGGGDESLRKLLLLSVHSWKLFVGR